MSEPIDNKENLRIVELSTGKFEVVKTTGTTQFAYGVFSSRAHAQQVLEQIAKQSKKTGGSSR